LAASPILAYAGLNSRWVDEVMAEPLPLQGTAALGAQNDAVIKSVKEALNVFDFDAAARTKLSTAHYTFITDGSFNNETLRANREGFNKYELRMRRLTGITKVDQSIKLFGVNWDSPIFFSPVGRMNAYYPQGAVVVGATVTARHTNTNLTRVSHSDSLGQYLIANLPAGAYEVTVEQAGFNPEKQSNLVLRVGEESTMDFVLQIAGVQQSVTVNAEAAGWGLKHGPDRCRKEAAEWDGKRERWRAQSIHAWPQRHMQEGPRPESRAISRERVADRRCHNRVPLR